MILGDVEIHKALGDKRLIIYPFDESCLGGGSYDFHLSRFFRVFKAREAMVIDPLVDQRHLMELVTVDDRDFFILHPGEFALASSMERFTFSEQVVGRLEGKSSVARFGLIIHAAGFFDPAFDGHATLELFNPTSLPIKLYPYMLIGQMSFLEVKGKVTKPYGGKGSKYQGQGMAPEPSRYFENYPHGHVYGMTFEEAMDRADEKIEQAIHPIVPPYIGDFRVASQDLYREPIDVRAQAEAQLGSIPVHDAARTEGTLYRTKSGKVLTDEDIEALADEAERGYDVSHLRERKPDQLHLRQDLFSVGKFTSHAGRDLMTKVECDSLSDNDLDVLAEIVSQNLMWSRVVAAGGGTGERFAKALEPFCQIEGPILIADDVWTTSTSIIKKAAEVARETQYQEPVKAVVIFMRGPVSPPPWVHAIWFAGLPIP